MTLTWNLPLNFDVAFCNWLDKFLPPTDISFCFEQKLLHQSPINLLWRLKPNVTSLNFKQNLIENNPFKSNAKLIMLSKLNN